MTSTGLNGDSERTVLFAASEGDKATTEASIRVYSHGPWTVLEASGELGSTVTRGLRDLIGSTPSSWLVCDLSRATYLDHSPLAVLAHAHRTARSLGGAVRLVQPPRSTLTLLRLSRTYDLPPVFDTIEEALG